MRVAASAERPALIGVTAMRTGGDGYTIARSRHTLSCLILKSLVKQFIAWPKRFRYRIRRWMIAKIESSNRQADWISIRNYATNDHDVPDCHPEFPSDAVSVPTSATGRRRMTERAGWRTAPACGSVPDLLSSALRDPVSMRRRTLSGLSLPAKPWPNCHAKHNPRVAAGEVRSASGL